MLPLMFVHVNQLYGLADRFDDGVAQSFRFADDSNNGTVVALVGAVVQQLDVILAAEAVQNFLDLRKIASLTIIRYTLNDTIHAFPPKTAFAATKAVSFSLIFYLP